MTFQHLFTHRAFPTTAAHTPTFPRHNDAGHTAARAWAHCRSPVLGAIPTVSFAARRNAFPPPPPHPPTRYGEHAAALRRGATYRTTHPHTPSPQLRRHNCRPPLPHFLALPATCQGRRTAAALLCHSQRPSPLPSRRGSTAAGIATTAGILRRAAAILRQLLFPTPHTTTTTPLPPHYCVALLPHFTHTLYPYWHSMLLSPYFLCSIYVVHSFSSSCRKAPFATMLPLLTPCSSRTRPPAYLPHATFKQPVPLLTFSSPPSTTISFHFGAKLEHLLPRPLLVADVCWLAVTWTLYVT